MTFSKKDSLALKGIAISLMLMHHNFMSEAYFKKYNVDFTPFSQNSVVKIAIFCKICVGIFVFISSYGLTISLIKNEINKTNIDKYIINRLIKVLSGYWFIVVLSNIICQVIDKKTSLVYFKDGIINGIMTIIINFFGLSQLCGTNQLNGTWWYMSLAVMIVFMVPVCLILYRKIGYTIPLFFCILTPRVLKIGDNNMTNWILLIFLGVIFAEYNLMVRFKKFNISVIGIRSSIIKFSFNTLILLLCIFIYSKMPIEIKYSIIPLFVTYYCYEFVIYIKGVRELLVFLGKHSMNIFLTHTFIRYYYLSDFIYSFKHFLIINLVLLIISICLSIIIEYIKKVIKYDKYINKFQEYILSIYKKLFIS